MSTPRHSNAPHGMNPDTDWPNTEPEGVAAPLEPLKLTAKQFWMDQPFPFENRFEFAEAYAAAVSKNMQEELAHVHKELERLKTAINIAANEVLILHRLRRNAHQPLGKCSVLQLRMEPCWEITSIQMCRLRRPPPREYSSQLASEAGDAALREKP